MSSIASKWVHRFHPATAPAARLICLPHAGGSASFFFPMSKMMRPRWEVLAIQYPGRQERRLEPCIDDLGALADAITPHLETWLDRPVAIFGHSMGATLAFEIALRLKEIGVDPVALFVSGRGAPSVKRDDRLHQLDDQALLKHLKMLDGTSPDLLVDRDVLEMIIPALRADYRAAETYCYRESPPIAAPIYGYTGVNDPRVGISDIDAWRSHTTGPFALQTYPGGHFYLVEHAASVVDSIEQALDCGIAAAS